MARVLGLALAASLLLASATIVAVLLQKREELTFEEGRELVYLPPTIVAELASLGHRGLAADIFWVQARHYSGTTMNRRYHYRDLSRFIDLVVHLDPLFEHAYVFGAASIPYNSGQRRWENVEESSRIIEKGLEHFPDNWLLWLHLGFNRGIIGTDRPGAAEAFAEAARRPGAPGYLGLLATRYYASSGAFEAARIYAEVILETTHDPMIAEQMERRLYEIDIEEALVAIDTAVQEYIRRHGEPPGRLEDLVSEGIMESLPPDRLNGTYYLEEGEARSTSLHRGRLRPFQEATGGRDGPAPALPPRQN